MSAARSGCFQAFSPWYADRQAPAFPECLRESMAAPKQAGTATPCPSGHRGIPGPCLPAGNPHATPDKARGIPGASPSAIPEKNRPGRPCGGLATAKKNAIEARWCHYEGISRSLFSQGQARELSGPFRVQAQGTGREVQALPPGNARSGSGRGSGLVVAGCCRKGGPARARAGLRHPDHGDRLSAAGHLHAGGRVQPFRCL